MQIFQNGGPQTSGWQSRQNKETGEKDASFNLLFSDCACDVCGSLFYQTELRSLSCDQWHQLSAVGGFLSPECDCIAAGSIASFQAVTCCCSSAHISEQSAQQVMPSSPPAPCTLHPPPLHVFDHFLSLFVSFSAAWSFSLIVWGVIDSNELSHDCIIISLPCTFVSQACNEYCIYLYIYLQADSI